MKSLNIILQTIDAIINVRMSSNH